MSTPHPAPGGPPSREPAAAEAERIAAEVASAVGLAEGPPGVRAVIRSIARGAGSTRAVGRETSLPLPLVAAVCGELRARGVLTADRPARLSAAGARTFAGGRVASTGRCPTCAGRGSVVTDEAELVTALAGAAAAVPPVRVELDQTHCTVETKVRRVLALHDAGALAGRRLLVLGDDDLVSVAIAAFAARHGAAAGPSSLAVVEVDRALVGYLRERLRDAPFPVDVVEHDLTEPLPDRLLGTADTVQTDPPYTVAGATLFLTRAASALRPGAGADLFLSLGVRRPAETVQLQEVMARLGLAVRSLVPGFNEYAGAGVLGGTSALWHLVTAAPAEPAASTVYTGAGRSRRRYACADCGTVQTVGEGRRWRSVGELKQAGCPRCGGRTFRPRSRPDRGTARAR
ncbi:MAG: bis-aminopropyl spermidine synthase family protein [Mycobacteriales bacterium]